MLFGFDTIFIIRILIILVAVGLAAYFDNKTGYIYDWISIPLIIAGLIINVFTYYWIDILEICLVALIIYAVGYIAYYYGKIGGGDIKLFIGIHMMLPFFFNQLFIVWVIIVSSLLSVLFVSIGYIIKLYGKVKLTPKLWKSKKWLIIKSTLMFLIFFAFVIIATIIGDLPKIVYVTIPPMFFGCLVMVFEEEVKRYIYLRQKPIAKLEEGDVLASEFATKALLEKLGLGKRTVLEKEDIVRIKTLDLKTLPIFDYLPRFGIYIFLGVAFVLVFGYILF